MLMAYADGILDAAERAIVEAAIRENPEYQQKVKKFRATLKPVHQAIADGVDVSRLDPLVERIRRGEGAPSLAAAIKNASQVATPRSKTQVPLSSVWPSWPTAMAASLALLVGAGAGWLAHRASGPMATATPALVAFANGSLRAEGSLARVLESMSSGSAVEARAAGGRAWQLKASFSFRSVSGSPCRRYEIGNDAAGRFAGYACRSADGIWLVQAHTKVGNGAPDGTKFTPAAGSEDGALDAAIRAATDGDVLQSGEESELIAKHWAENGK
jgi:anti-sigma factor RsiW